MPAKKTKTTVDDEIVALRAAAGDLRSPAFANQLRAALNSRHARIVVAAAGLVKEHRLDGFDQSLRAAWARFLENPNKSDPGCRAKLAALEALDYTEATEPEPFLSAARYVQLEPSWGAPADSAAGVRGRALLALARIGYADLVLLAGELLTDPQPAVRLAAADALAHFGERHGAGALLLKLGVPDEDPMVTVACMSALLCLAPDHGMRRLGPLLNSTEADQREFAAVALGESGREDAAEALISSLHACVTSKQREVLLRALGLHRSDRAASVLLETVESPNATDAEAAVKALATRRFEPGFRERVRAAVGEREALQELFREAFSELI